jgi:hypothetical protein
MFDRGNLCSVGTDGRGQMGFDDIIKMGLDGAVMGQIFANESDAAIRRGGLDGQSHLFSGVKPYPGTTHIISNGSLPIVHFFLLRQFH